MTDQQEVERIYRNHVKWYASVRREHAQHRAFYGDEAWSKDATGNNNPTVPVGGEAALAARPESRINRTQVNLVRPWVTSFIASLYYRGVKFVVTPDERETGLEQEEVLDVSNALRGELNRAFAIEDTEDAAERLFTMGLIYRGGVAFKVGVDGENKLVKDKPQDRLWIEALPPYECVWDRKTRSKRTVKYMGHLYPMSLVEARALYNIPADVTGIPLPDVVAEGFDDSHRQHETEDATYVRILELTAFEEVATFEGAKSQGEFSVWMVQHGRKGAAKAVELARTATPFDKPSKAPLANIVPFISEPSIEFPLDSYAPVKSVVELNAEYNIAASIVSEAFRRDSTRIILYLKGKGVGEDDITKIMNGSDLEFIGLDADVLEGLFKHLELPPISDTLLEYIKLLQDSVDRTQLIADFARGKAGDYLSATEVANLVNYTETTIGRIRKRMDATLARVAQLYLRALHAEMKGKITIDIDGKSIDIKKKHLDLRWNIQVVDTASTPAAAAQKLADLAASAGMLLDLTERIEAGGMVGQMATEILTLMVSLQGLPPSMLPSALEAATPDPPVEEPAPSPPAPQPEQVPLAGGSPPEGSVAASPVGQAIMAQSEEEALV